MTTALVVVILGWLKLDNIRFSEKIDGLKSAIDSCPTCKRSRK